MNYCPNCGSNVESSWKVCANCGHRLVDEETSVKTQEEPESQAKKVEVVTPKPSYVYVKPQRKYGITALILGIIGFSLSFLIMALRTIGFSALDYISILIAGNAISLILSILAVIFGILGIAKDDSRGMGIAGLILGVLNIMGVFVRFGVFMGEISPYY